jgi:hypothetical protein
MFCKRNSVRTIRRKYRPKFAFGVYILPVSEFQLVGYGLINGYFVAFEKNGYGIHFDPKKSPLQFCQGAWRANNRVISCFPTKSQRAI